jgi:hypothetical protein
MLYTIYMPEGAEVPIQEKHKSLETQEYQWAKTRIEASKRIANELYQGVHVGPAHLNNPSVLEIGSLIRERRHYGGLADARKYDEQRIKMIYHSSDETGSVSEDLVFFLKPDEQGHPEMLEVEGKPLFLNGDLFDAKYPTRLTHNIEEPDIYVPNVDHTGKITSFVRVMGKGRPLELNKLENPK